MTVLVDNPTGSDLATFLGRSGDSQFATTAAAYGVGLARSMAKSYTRGVGFESDSAIPESLSWVIISRGARLVLNYEQLISEQRDNTSLLYGSAGQGWTLSELTALNEFRRIAA
jgi:hypothetical protein